ncbi:MAG TPA: hypothetical protein VJH24_05230 [Candidatus Bilamarchaeaceae archaeon]|nr:hypothetical protein [Candidatus Bilamarchaeaceae archaeon]
MIKESREHSRQLVHIGMGSLFIAIVFWLGRTALLTLSFFSLIIGSLLINMAFQGKRFFLIEWAEKFERRGVQFPGYGSAWYMVGVLLLASFLTDRTEIASGILLLGLSDGLSTIIGSLSHAKLPYNPKKSWEGSLIFFLSGLITFSWIGPSAIALAFVAALVESLPLPLDDNVTVPIATVLFFYMV